MLSNRQKRENLEDEYVFQMKNFRRAEERYDEIRHEQRRFTESLCEQLSHYLREVPYESVSPYLSEIYQAGDSFQREINFFENQLEEKRMAYLKHYRQEMDDLEREWYEQERNKNL